MNSQGTSDKEPKQNNRTYRGSAPIATICPTQGVHPTEMSSITIVHSAESKQFKPFFGLADSLPPGEHNRTRHPTTERTPDASPFIPAVDTIVNGSALENVAVIRCCGAAHRVFLAAVADEKPNGAAQCAVAAVRKPSTRAVSP